MKQDLLIIGAGCVGGHIASNLDYYTSEYNLLGFLDDNSSKIGEEFVGYPILGNLDTIKYYPSTIAIFIGIAFPTVKLKVLNKLKKFGCSNFPSLISKFTWVSKNVEIGAGTILYPGTTINYNCSIGDFVVINMNCSLGHDCNIESFVSFAPGVLLGGNTEIGNATQMGIGAKSIQDINIGQKCIVGAGAVIIRDVPNTAVVVGNPGRIIKYTSLSEYMDTDWKVILGNS